MVKDFSIKGYGYFIPEIVIPQEPFVKNCCGDMVLCSADPSAELHGKLVIHANCKEAPTIGEKLGSAPPYR
mgnify:CR=1 FL=1|jgi:hypothetical protein